MSESTTRRPAYARLLDRAVRILAVRDHSEQELRRKLSAPVMSKNGPEEIDATAEDYDRVIAWCYEHHYLDDDRFASRFLASRGRKGYGPARIRQELRERLISQRHQGAQDVLARLRLVAEADADLRSEYERWRLRFELLAVSGAVA